MLNRLEYIYNERDNTIDLILSSTVNDVITRADLSGVTRIMLTFEATVIDTNATEVSVGPGQNIDWTKGNGQLRLKLGNLDIPPGRYRNVKLDVYDSSTPDGIRWGHLDIIVE